MGSEKNLMWYSDKVIQHTAHLFMQEILCAHVDVRKVGFSDVDVDADLASNDLRPLGWIEYIGQFVQLRCVFGYGNTP